MDPIKLCDLCSSSGRLSSVHCYISVPVEGQNITVYKLITEILKITAKDAENKDLLSQLQICLSCQTHLLNAYKINQRIRTYLTAKAAARISAAPSGSKTPKKPNLVIDGFCFQCNEAFRDKNEKLEHELDNHPPNHSWFRCSICKEFFESAKDAIEHRRSLHFRKSFFICGICNKEDNGTNPKNMKQYRQTKDIYDHIQDSHQELFIPTANRETQDEFQWSPVQPIEKKSKDTLVPVPPPPVSGSPKDKKAAGEEEPFDCIIFNCPKCSEVIESDKALLHHLAHVHNEYSLTCDDCGTSFNRLADLTTHRVDHKHETQEFSYIDEPVSEAVQNESFLEYTIVNKKNKNGAVEKLFQCNKCDEAFVRKINFHKHSCAYYTNISNLKIKCRACEETFATVKEMYSHMGVHESKDPMSCILCDKFYHTIAGLKYHLKTHTGMKPFKCPYCVKKFTAAVNLRSHIRQNHSKSQLHACPICSKKYEQKSSLNKHLNTHGERKFKCTYCPKTYVQNSHLQEHMALHKGILFSCTWCGTAYNRASTLRKHLPTCQLAQKD